MFIQNIKLILAVLTLSSTRLNQKKVPHDTAENGVVQSRNTNAARRRHGRTLKDASGILHGQIQTWDQG